MKRNVLPLCWSIHLQVIGIFRRFQYYKEDLINGNYVLNKWIILHVKLPTLICLIYLPYITKQFVKNVSNRQSKKYVVIINAIDNTYFITCYRLNVKFYSV